MREILFRGISTNNDKWVYGYFGYDWDSNSDLKPCIQSSLTEMSSSFSRTIINTETIGQYTGLKDKEGNNIFEGDIVKFYEYLQDKRSTPTIKEVVWDDEGAWMPFNDPYYIDGEMGQGFNKEIGLEVIGSIHQHPELLVNINP